MGWLLLCPCFILPITCACRWALTSLSVSFASICWPCLFGTEAGETLRADVLVWSQSRQLLLRLQTEVGWTELMDRSLTAAALECGADEAAVRAAARSVPIATEVVQVHSNLQHVHDEGHLLQASYPLPPRSCRSTLSCNKGSTKASTARSVTCWHSRRACRCYSVTRVAEGSAPARPKACCHQGACRRVYKKSTKHCPCNLDSVL